MSRSNVFLLAAAFALGIASTASVAEDAKWGSEAEAKTIIVNEATWISKVCGPPVDLSFVAKDFHGTRRNGTRYDREIATSFRDQTKPRSRDCHIGEVDVRFFSDTTAIAYGSEGWINIAPDETETKFCEAWSDTWVKREGKWFLVSAQDAVVSCDEWWPTLKKIATILPNYKESYKKSE